MEALDALAWPVGRLGEAIAGLARLQGWRLRSVEAPVCPAGVEQGSPEALARVAGSGGGLAWRGSRAG